MSVHLLQAEAIFDGKSLLSGENLLIVDDSGRFLEIRPIQETDKNVKFYPGILTPGFINTHCHLELSHLITAIPAYTGMVDFLLSVMQLRKSTESQIIEAAKDAANTLYEQGVNLVGDICNTGIIQEITDHTPLKFYHFVETIGFDPNLAEKRFAFSRGIQEQYILKYPSSVVPHAPYSVSKKLFELTNQQSDDKVISIHHAESIAEQEFFQKEKNDFLRLHQLIHSDLSKHIYQKDFTSVQSFLPLYQNKKVILVHNVTITENDLKYIQQIEKKNHLEVYFAICIRANEYIGNGYPDLPLILQYFPDRVTIGTDSLASNDQLNMMHELQLLMELYPNISQEDWLKMLITNGAKALNYQDQLGEWNLGVNSGVVHVDFKEWRTKRLF